MHNSDIEDARPQESPYTSPVVKILISGTAFRIPTGILNRCPTLTSKQHQSITNIPVGVGHVLINYLFTNGYECLRPDGKSMQEKLLFEFKTALQVSRASQEYNLPHLESLADAEIKALGDRLSLSRMIEVFEETNQPPVHLPRVSSYLESRIHLLFNNITTAEANESMLKLKAPTRASEIFLKSIFSLKIQHKSCIRNSEGDTDSFVFPRLMQVENSETDAPKNDIFQSSEGSMCTPCDVLSPSSDIMSEELTEDGWLISEEEPAKSGIPSEDNEPAEEEKPIEEQPCCKIMPAELAINDVLCENEAEDKGPREELRSGYATPYEDVAEGAYPTLISAEDEPWEEFQPVEDPDLAVAEPSTEGHTASEAIFEESAQEGGPVVEEKLPEEVGGRDDAILSTIVSEAAKIAKEEQELALLMVKKLRRGGYLSNNEDERLTFLKEQADHRQQEYAADEAELGVLLRKKARSKKKKLTPLSRNRLEILTAKTRERAEARAALEDWAEVEAAAAATEAAEIVKQDKEIAALELKRSHPDGKLLKKDKARLRLLIGEINERARAQAITDGERARYIVERWWQPICQDEDTAPTESNN